MDQLMGEDNNGRVRRKLDQFGDLLGLVVGRLKEVSNDLSNLMERMAESRVAMVARRDGRELSDHEKGVVVGQLRRQLSTASIRAASKTACWTRCTSVVRVPRWLPRGGRGRP